MTSTLSGVPGGTFSYDNNDRLGIDTFDNNGNTTSSGSITNIYDFENRMTQHGTGILITYDGDGNRVSETAGGVTTKYLVDTLNPTALPQVLDETVSGSVTRTYAYGLQRISENQLVGSTWTPSFYGYDGHGNVRFLMNTAGAATDTYQYDAFGNTIASTGTTPNNFLFGGEQFDSSVGSLYLRARYYRLPTGRFLTMDPYEGTILDPASLHKYVYTRNNPVNAIDPTGRGEATIEQAQLIGIGLLASAGIIAFQRQIVCDFSIAASLVEGVAAPQNLFFVKSIQIDPNSCSATVTRAPDECEEIRQEIYRYMGLIENRIAAMELDPWDLFNLAHDTPNSFPANRYYLAWPPSSDTTTATRASR